RVDAAAGEVRAAREAQRRVAGRMDQARRRLRTAWPRFDGVRDAVAPLGPPPADRDDLAGAWVTLTGWALSEVDGRRARRETVAEAVHRAKAAATAAVDAIGALFADTGVTAPRDPAGYSRAAAVALTQAESA